MGAQGKRSQGLAAAATVVVLLVLAAACSSGSGTATDTGRKADSAAASDTAVASDTSTSDTGTSSDTVDTSITDDTSFTEDTVAPSSDDPTMTDANANAGSNCGGHFDNCFKRKDMERYFRLTISDFIEPWVMSQYTSLARPTAYVFVKDGETTSSACGEVDDQAYQYCSFDKTVYVGQAFQWYLYNKFGAIGPAVATAHEFGHHIQDTKLVPDPPQATPEEVNHEDQADCVAGAWVNWADEQGMVDYPKDLENVAALMTAISDAESPDQTHGTSSQRTKSFSVGFGGGLAACNTFYPNNPITP